MGTSVRALFQIIALAVCLGWSSGATAQARLHDPFEPSSFTYSELELVQRALTFSGLYSGLWDGDWGPLSNDALQTYSLEFYGESQPTNYTLAPLLLEGIALVESMGWSEEYFPDVGYTVGLPLNYVSRDWTSGTVLFIGEDLLVELFVHAAADVAAAHAALANDATRQPYLVRRQFRLVTAAERDGGLTYLRSDWDGQRWVSLWIDSVGEGRQMASYVSSSYRAGPLEQIPDSEIANLTAILVAAVADAAIDQPPSLPTSTGTGFFVNASTVITNYHVVEGCAALATADGSALAVLAYDEQNDLAALRFEGRSGEHLSLAEDDAIRLGAEVAALGFPLYGQVSTEMSYTAGVISGVNGPAGDTATFGLTAPIQPGNSGGPVLDDQGRVVGVAVGTYSPRLAEVGGFIPQNLNWAIKSSTLRSFLEEHSLGFTLKPQTSHVMDRSVPDGVVNAVAAIMCR